MTLTEMAAIVGVHVSNLSHETIAQAEKTGRIGPTQAMNLKRMLSQAEEQENRRYEQ